MAAEIIRIGPVVGDRLVDDHSLSDVARTQSVHASPWPFSGQRGDSLAEAIARGAVRRADDEMDVDVICPE